MGKSPEANGAVERFVDENAPLLAHADPPQTAADPPTKSTKPLPAVVDDSGAPEEEVDKPLPVAQIFLLCYARLVEPIAFFSIFPFISQMIHEVGGVKESDIGFTSGMIVSP